MSMLPGTNCRGRRRKAAWPRPSDLPAFRPSGPPAFESPENKMGRQQSWRPLVWRPEPEIYWSGVPPVSGAAVPLLVKKIVPAVAVENPRVPVWPTDAGTAVA